MPMLPYSNRLEPANDSAIWRFMDLRKFRDLMASDLRGAQAATGRSCSEPITQSFGCWSTRVTNAFSVRARF